MPESNALRDYIRSRAHLPRPPFRPFAWYNVLGNQLDVYWSDADAFEDQLNERMSVLRDMKTREVVGVKVYGVAGLLFPKAGAWPLYQLAEQAARSCAERSKEDIRKWARQLAADVADATD